jgi:RNA-directed DNA polymerase
LEEAKSVVTEFLKERGLTLSAEKTRITHIESGFDFLGWNFRKYDGKFLIKPSEKSVNNHVRKIREIIKAEKDNSQRELIRRLNPIIGGWANYHAGQVSAEAFHKVDFKVWQYLWKWAKRRHPSKSRQWIKDRYFHKVIRKGSTRDWMFGTIEGEEEYRLLQLHSDKPIRRHIKVRAEANPFDPEWEEYFEERNIQLMNRFWSNKLKTLWKKQEGICPICQQVIIAILSSVNIKARTKC